MRLESSLAKKKNGMDLSVAYLFCALIETKLNYSTTEKECVRNAVKQFQSYHNGRKFILTSDHEPLRWMDQAKDPNQRWRSFFAEKVMISWDSKSVILVDYLKKGDSKISLLLYPFTSFA